MLKIRKGDQVVVTTGRDKGKRGEVSQVLNTEYLLVNGVNQVKRHTRPNPMKNQPGGILSKEMPIHVSNVAIWNASSKKPDRVGFRLIEVPGQKPRKVRFFKSNGEQLGS
ncbi:MAG: 50S ribosomal protein L24 [Burkholderiales bacterium]|jgi:large subunit ribosomal protein L24|nr:50S ribosomal protein L24 [Burkholderiales bacterium]